MRRRPRSFLPRGVTFPSALVSSGFGARLRGAQPAKTKFPPCLLHRRRPQTTHRAPRGPQVHTSWNELSRPGRRRSGAAGAHAKSRPWEPAASSASLGPRSAQAPGVEARGVSGALASEARVQPGGARPFGCPSAFGIALRTGLKRERRAAWTPRLGCSEALEPARLSGDRQVAPPSGDRWLALY